jgi:hemerythrin-like metal-binding protein
MDFKWKKDYETGLPEIDDQHKYFFQLFEKLYNTVSKTNNDDEISELISEFKAYTVYHFKTEEDLFEKYKYDENEKNKHLLKHLKLCETIRKFENEDTISMGILGYKLVDFAQKWLIEHIMSTDMLFVNFINSQQKK